MEQNNFNEENLFEMGDLFSMLTDQEIDVYMVKVKRVVTKTVEEVVIWDFKTQEEADNFVKSLKDKKHIKEISQPYSDVEEINIIESKELSTIDVEKDVVVEHLTGEALIEMLSKGLDDDSCSTQNNI